VLVCAQAAGEEPKLSIVKEVAKEKEMDCNIVFLVEIDRVATNASFFINVFILSAGAPNHARVVLHPRLKRDFHFSLKSAKHITPENRINSFPKIPILASRLRLGYTPLP